MAPPSTFKMGGLTNCTCPAKRYYLVAFIEMWLGALPTVLFELIYLGVALSWNPFGCPFLQGIINILALVHPYGQIGIWLLFPFHLLAGYYLYVFCAIHVARFFLFFEGALHEPREGVFSRNLSDPDYFHWNARRFIKKFPVWLGKITPFPWMRRSYIYNTLGAKVGDQVGLIEAWVDMEMVTIEDGVAIGRAATITSHYLTPEHLILYPVHLKRGALIGEKARITPGTVVGERAIIVAKSVTRMESVVPNHHIFEGNPAIDIGEVPSA